ncbi:hypothetical protein ACKI1K_00615 [Streptomyces scabiei]|uniref:hypothetical protein n=1 Tax=Streptomyces scabiei TaxID=1930 RepID=UPI0038F63D04
MTEPDPELLGWIGDFIRERKRVTVEDIRREFFPGEMSRPYLYLDQLKAEGVIKWSRKTGLYLMARHPRTSGNPAPDSLERGSAV